MLRHTRGFVATPGHQLLAADYSQIELRVLAHLTDDANLVRAFQEGQDIHAATAAQLFGVAEPQVSREQRRVAKTVVFGVIYGISAFGLAPRIGASRGEAQALIVRPPKAKVAGQGDVVKILRLDF